MEDLDKQIDKQAEAVRKKSGPKPKKTEENTEKVSSEEKKPLQKDNSELKDKVEANDEFYTAEIIESHEELDPFFLEKKDPRYVYRYLRDDNKNLSVKTGNLLNMKGGWQLCDRKHLQALGIQDRFIGPDGLRRVGDTVLAFMPKELHQKKEAHKQLKSNDQVKRVDERLAQGEHVPGVHRTMTGIKTQKNLGM